MTAAAVGLAAGQSFGTFPGRVPAFLHEAYRLAAGVQRARVAVALARAWVYGGGAHPGGGVAPGGGAAGGGGRGATPVAPPPPAPLLRRLGARPRAPPVGAT